MALSAEHEVGPTDLGFSNGLLLQIVDALRETTPGALLAVTSRHPDVRENLERWARFTGNTLIEATEHDGGTRWVIRNGPAPIHDAPPIGSRMWVYSNFDCNLACQYCCVRSSPKAERRTLPLAVASLLALQAVDVGVQEVFITGGEPFLREDIAAFVSTFSEVAKTAVLTNGALFSGRRRVALEQLSRARVALQISLDSAQPARHDLMRGAGTWAKAWDGIRTARALGFRVRIAATVTSANEEAELSSYFDDEKVATEDRVIRRVALRGFADAGVALARSDLYPELTVTAKGVYFHPVGADDDDFLIVREILPLAAAVLALKEAYERERAHADSLAAVFHCA